MKVKRLKTAKRHVQFYKQHFHVSDPPYKVIVDGTFCKAALTDKVDILEQLPKYLEGQVELFTTPCALAECESFGSLLYGPLKVLRQYTVLKCKHPGPVLASKCIFSFVKDNKQGYFIGTQDKELSTRLRLRKGVPLLFISHHAITLEKPSETSQEAASKSAKEHVLHSNYERDTLQRLKEQAFGTQNKVIKGRRKKGPKEPNPLSCRRKLGTTSMPDSSQYKSKGKKKSKKKKKSKAA